MSRLFRGKTRVKLSVVEDHWPEIRIVEDIPVEGITPQALIIRVGSVFTYDSDPKARTGIWVNYDSGDGDNLYGPVLMDYESWKKVNKHVKKRWRDRTWPIYIWFDKMTAKLSALDIQLR